MKLSKYIIFGSGGIMDYYENRTDWSKYHEDIDERNSNNNSFFIADVFAGFWIRFTAKVLDFFLMSILYSISFSLYFNLVEEFYVEELFPYFFVFLCFLYVFYNVCFTGKFSATSGKMVCGIKIILGDGNPYLRGLERYLWENYSFLFLCIGFLMVAWDNEKRGLHDRICNSRVIYNKY